MFSAIRRNLTTIFSGTSHPMTRELLTGSRNCSQIALRAHQQRALFHATLPLRPPSRPWHRLSDSSSLKSTGQRSISNYSEQKRVEALLKHLRSRLNAQHAEICQAAAECHAVLPHLKAKRVVEIVIKNMGIQESSFPKDDLTAALQEYEQTNK